MPSSSLRHCQLEQASSIGMPRISGLYGANPGLALRWAVWLGLISAVDRLLELVVTPLRLVMFAS